MSLQIWLPLNGNLNNQGLSDLEFSVSVAGVTAADNGKIGKSYSSNGSGTIVSNKRINLGKQHSMFCWVKLNSFNSSSNLTGLFGQHRYPIEAGMGLTCKYVSSTTGYLSVTWGNGVSREYVKQTGNTLLSAGKWYHIGYTYDGTTLIFYVNGKNDGEHTIKAEIIEDYFQLFSWSFGDYTSTQSVHSGYKLNGNLNDVRVYDHVLSPKEVHLISQGLFVHYPLRDPHMETTQDLCYDCSGFNNHANIIGSIAVKNDGARGDYSLFLEDGRYDFLKTNEITIPTDEITLSCWFNAYEAGYGDGGGYHIPINFGSGHCELSVNSEGKIRTGFYAPSRFVDNGENVSIIDGKWHFLTTTFDGTTIKRYVDGTITKSTAISSAPQPLANKTGNLFIGNYNGTKYGNKNAKMSDVRIYATALSAEDIMELYDTPITITSNQKLIANEFKEVE